MVSCGRSNAFPSKAMHLRLDENYVDRLRLKMVEQGIESIKFEKALSGGRGI